MQASKQASLWAGGEQSAPSVLLGELKGFADYQTPDYCLSCAYFQQAKGHFGRCIDKTDGKIYDGSKRGTGCAVWRLKTSLIGFDGHSPEPIVKVQTLQKGLFSQMGSLISSEKYPRIHPLPNLSRFHGRRGLIDDYSFPPCPICKAPTVRHGHTDLGAQRYWCKGTERHIFHVDKVVAGKPWNPETPLPWTRRQVLHLFPFVPPHLIRHRERKAELAIFREQLKEAETIYTEDYKSFTNGVAINDWLGTLSVPTKVSASISKNCPKCHSSGLVKWGIRHDKEGDIQRYGCKKCGKRFSVGSGRFKANKSLLRFAIKLWINGLSTREISRELRDKGLAISHKAIWVWLSKYRTWCKSR